MRESVVERVPNREKIQSENVAVKKKNEIFFVVRKSLRIFVLSILIKNNDDNDNQGKINTYSTRDSANISFTAAKVLSGVIGACSIFSFIL